MEWIESDFVKVGYHSFKNLLNPNKFKYNGISHSAFFESDENEIKLDWIGTSREPCTGTISFQDDYLSFKTEVPKNSTLMTLSIGMLKKIHSMFKENIEETIKIRKRSRSGGATSSA